MNKYLLVYSGGQMPLTDAERTEALKAWGEWYTALGSAVVDPGNPFGPVAKSVLPGGIVKEGPVGVMATGYTVLQANSLDEAIKMAKGCPVLIGKSSITVYETFNIM